MSRFRAITIYLPVRMMLTAAFLFVGVTGASSEDAAAPKAVFPDLIHDFGEVFEGVEVKYDFVVENRGDAPLVIKNIRPD